MLAVRQRKGNVDLYSCKQLHACLYLVSVHQMAPPLIVVEDIQLQLITHLMM